MSCARERHNETQLFSARSTYRKPSHGAAIDGEPFRPFEFAIGQRGVKLERETVVDGVAADQLGDGAVLVLTGRSRNFVSIQQRSCKVRDLLSDRAIKSVPTLPLR